MSGQSQDLPENRLRETYEEFTVGDATVAMIADPQDQNAWIQSNVTTQVVP